NPPLTITDKTHLSRSNDHSYPHSPIFLFHPPLPHRSLHSFPTRRSSDLIPNPTSRSLYTTPNPTYLPDPVSAPLNSMPNTPKKTDRKSTRLNSSHLGISYAVFCLKKKKTYQHNLKSQKSDNDRTYRLIYI